MSLEKDIEEMYGIVQEIKAKEAEILTLKEKLRLKAQKMADDKKPGEVGSGAGSPLTIGTHKRGRPRKTTTPEPEVPQAQPQSEPEGIDPVDQKAIDDTMRALDERP